MECTNTQAVGQKAFNELCSKDKCGNPMIYPQNAKLTASEQKQVHEYSMHCAMYKVFQGAQVRIAKKWFFRIQKEKKLHKQLIK